jgi:hypothetical protein
MKTTLLLLLMLVLWASCGFGPLQVPQFASPAEAFKWVYFTGPIEYRADGGIGNCETPDVTLARGYGDCEDLCLLFQTIVHDQFGIDVWMALGKCADGSYHAEPWLDGWFSQWRVDSMGFKPFTYLSYTVSCLLQPVLCDEKGETR